MIPRLLSLGLRAVMSLSQWVSEWVSESGSQSVSQWVRGAVREKLQTWLQWGKHSSRALSWLLSAPPVYAAYRDESGCWILTLNLFRRRDPPTSLGGSGGLSPQKIFRIQDVIFFKDCFTIGCITAKHGHFCFGKHGHIKHHTCVS